jgi:hypothetical protein
MLVCAEKDGHIASAKQLANSESAQAGFGLASVSELYRSQDEPTEATAAIPLRI